MDDRNLTKENRLAFQVPELVSRPGHHVVVVDLEGKEGPRLLGPRETVKRSWYRKAVSFVAYAIPAGPHLRHRFSRPWQTVDQLHSFTLHYRLEFRILEPLRLVERLATDPLQQLEDEVDALVGGRVRRLVWDVIVEEGDDLEGHLSPVMQGEIENQPSLLESLRDFASDLGLGLTKIGVTRTVPEMEPVVKREVEVKKRLVMELEHETDLHKERLQLEKESLVERRKIATVKAAAVKSWIGASGEEGARALGKMVDNIEYPDGLPRAVNAVIEGARILDGAESRPPREVPRSTSSALLEGGAATGANLSLFLTELTQQFLRLPCDALERRNLLSAALHLVGEVIRGEPAESKILQEYKKKIDEGFLRNVDALDREQNKLFKRLKNVDSLKREFSW